MTKTKAWNYFVIVCRVIIGCIVIPILIASYVIVISAVSLIPVAVWDMNFNSPFSVGHVADINTQVTWSLIIGHSLVPILAIALSRLK